MNNRIVVDLNKVQHAKLCYRTKQGFEREIKPATPTVFGEWVSNDDFAMDHPNWPRETMLQRARRRNLLDVWVPHLFLQLSANHCLVYTGKKALSIWKEWNRRIFNKSKKGKK